MYLETHCKETKQINEKNKLYVDNFGNNRVIKFEDEIQSNDLVELVDYVIEKVSSSYKPRSYRSGQSFIQQNKLETMEYNIRYLPRKSILIYDKENPLVRTAGIRATSE